MSTTFENFWEMLTDHGWSLIVLVGVIVSRMYQSAFQLEEEEIVEKRPKTPPPANTWQATSEKLQEALQQAYVPQKMRVPLIKDHPNTLPSEQEGIPQATQKPHRMLRRYKGWKKAIVMNIILNR